MKLRPSYCWITVVCLGLTLFALSCKGRSPSGTNAGQANGDPANGPVGQIEAGKTASRSAAPVVDQSSQPGTTSNGKDLNALIRQAAGPMADHVNSSLARLNTNLGQKEHTLVIMAMKSETRRRYFLMYFVDIINDEQFLQASDIIDSYADQYQDLLDRRARILENARDGQDTEQLLKFNKVAAIKLSIEVRKHLIRDVLDREQKKQYADKFAPPSENEPNK